MTDRWDEAEAELRAVSPDHRAKRKTVCETVAMQLLTADVVPPWRLSSPDDAVTFCADRYWRRRFLDVPLASTAVECAQWLYQHSDEPLFRVLGQRWALGYGFITRSTMDSASDLASLLEDMMSSVPVPEIGWVVQAYHAQKMRANFSGGPLAEFLDRSPLTLLVGEFTSVMPLPALRCFAAFRAGEPAAVARAQPYIDRLGDLGPANVEIMLHGMAMAPKPEQYRDLQVEVARRAIELWPEEALLHFRLAEGLQWQFCLDEALSAVDSALQLLPADGTSDSHIAFQTQFLGCRTSIQDLMLRMRATTRAAEAD